MGDLDAALVEAVCAPSHVNGPAPIRWGRLSGQRAGVRATGMGFPRVMKTGAGERLPEQVDGTLNPGTA